MKNNYNGISKHALERAKLLCGYNTKKMDDLASKAYRYGKKAEDFTFAEREYLLKETREDSFAVAYEGFCFIFSTTGRCITLYLLPNWFNKTIRFARNAKIRNFKKYTKYNSNKQYTY